VRCDGDGAGLTGTGDTVETTKVFIIDDHALVRYGLRMALEADGDFTVVGEAASGEAAIEALVTTETDLVLLDLRMPGIGGVETCRLLLKESPALRVVVLTSFDDEEDVVSVLDAGAVGYLLKDASPAALLQALRDVGHGQTVLDSGVARRLVRTNNTAPQPAEALPQLSEREMAVLKLMARGFSNRQIASELWISEPTVKTHVSHILRKMEMTDRTKAVVEAIRLGVVTPE